MVSLCSCREVTGAGAEPQSSVSDTGTADTADHPALPCPDLPWHMTPLTPAGSGENSSYVGEPLTHITKIISFICAISCLIIISSTSGFLYSVFNEIIIYFVQLNISTFSTEGTKGIVF